MMLGKSEHTEVELLDVSFRSCDDFVVVTVRGEIDLASADKLDDVLKTVIDEGAENVALDMRDVTYMDGEGIKALLRANLKIRDRGGRLMISQCSSTIKRTLEILGLGRLCNTTFHE